MNLPPRKEIIDMPDINIGESIMLADGTRIEDLKKTIEDFGFYVNDIVYHRLAQTNSLIFYRIVEDIRPRQDAIWGEIQKEGRRPRGLRISSSPAIRTYKYQTWVDNKGKIIKSNILYGAAKLVPCFSMFTTDSNRRLNSKVIKYSNLQFELKKLDLVELSAMHNRIGCFIREELDRIVT